MSGYAIVGFGENKFDIGEPAYTDSAGEVFHENELGKNGNLILIGYGANDGSGNVVVPVPFFLVDPPIPETDKQAMSDTQLKLTDAEIDALEGEALRVAVADMVMGWSIDESEHFAINANINKRYYVGATREVWLYEWLPDVNANAAREVEAEIERRGLQGEYLTILCRQNKPAPSNPLDWPWWEYGKYTMFGVFTASPADRCRAALKAVRG